ncbi:MAG: gliding motility-associated C-terminal domain-containing protein [Saprospiraceae bacterium]|nr:gliding motility-associated C-terminal domain-containing protein [Saprospiraceae bacterium]
MKKLLLFGALLFWFNGLMAQTNFIHQDSIFTRTSNCDAGVSVCIDSFTYDSINSLRFYLNGRQFSTTFTPCFIDTIHNYGYTDIYRGLERGPWHLDSWTVSGQTFTGTFASLEILVDSMRLWDPSGDWRLEPISRTIYGFAKNGRQYSCQNITGLGRGGRSEICYNIGVEFRGLRFSVPSGVSQFVVEKTSTGLRDTVQLISACIKPDTVRRTIAIGSTQNYCFDTSQLLGTTTALVNYCSRSTTKVIFDILSSSCIRYAGNDIGSDTACLQMCDQYGNCDTTILIVTAENPTSRTTIIEDTITVGLTRTHAGIVVPIGRITTIENFCPSSSGSNVSFTLNAAERTITFTGVTEGVDTACIQVCSSLNICDTTIYRITAIPVVNPVRPTAHTFRDTITIGLAARPKCTFDAPLGTATIFQNICAGASGNNIAFTLDTTTKCVRYAGTTVGTDTACIRICNALGECDTTYMYVETLQAPVIRRIHEFRDTITIGLDRDKCTFDAPANATRIRNICEAQSGSNIDFSVDTIRRCINYMGVTAGVDTACIEICDALGLCDTTYMYITAQTSQILRGRFLTDSIIVRVGETKTYCADSSQVSSNFFRQFINSNPNYAAVTPTSNACLSIRGAVIGRDTITWVLIGGNNIQDTTRLFIIVQPALAQPTPSVDTISLKIFETKTYCPDSSELRGSPIRYIGFCATTPFDNSSVSLDTTNKCVNVRGLSNGQDTFCIVICNNAGFCDTTTLYVNVSRDTVLPTLKLDSVSVFVGDSLTYCGIDTSEIRGTVDTIYNYCAQSSGVNSTVSITAAKCLIIKGLRTGTDTACIIVCNRTSGLCDTTRVKITVKPRVAVPSVDSLVVSVGQTKNYCPDSTELRGSLVTSISFCSTPTADNATITLDSVTKCVKVVGNTEGRDTACVILCNAAGTCDTTTLYVRVTPRDTSKPTVDTARITLNLNQDSLFCGIDTSQIRGAVDTIYDACPGRNGTKALMVLNTDTKCVRITGRAIGQDTMCVVVFNRTSGLYDTTTIIVTVRDARGVIVKAVDDFDTMRRGQVKDFFVYINDTLSRSATSLTIIQAPKNGRADTVSFNRGLIQYFSGRSPAACGLDSFRYRVCIDTVCSEATVVVMVVCSDSLVVYNGISPNGDSKNQTWLIEGLQNYPNHTVCVFNRWGNEVLKTQNYQNDWSGTWNGKDLPDGTYFYWIRNDDNGEILKTGYLQIMR